MAVSSAPVRINLNRRRRASRAVPRRPGDGTLRVLSTIRFRRRDQRSLTTGPSNGDGRPNQSGHTPNRRLLTGSVQTTYAPVRAAGWPVPGGDLRAGGRFASAPFLAKCSYRAQRNKAPSMYEMEGALPGLATLGRPVAQPARRHAPPAGTRYPCEGPVSRLLPRPGVAPGWFPFPTVKVFLLLSLQSRKSLRQFILSFSMSTRCPQCAGGYPHMIAVIHRLMHSSSTGYAT